MAYFIIRFSICNVFISAAIGILLAFKRIFRNHLSSRMQYNLWFLLLWLLAAPFIPFHLAGSPQLFFWLSQQKSNPLSEIAAAIDNAIGRNPLQNTDWMNDLALSVNSRTVSVIGYILLGIWLLGILGMMILIIKSSLRLHILEKSALPVQSQKVHRLYQHCLNELKIHANIPICSTAFLKSPMITGILKPCIYLPIHLISDYNESSMRYMLLHELQHYKHRDALAGFLMDLAGVLYWFNPLVWYALREMRNDRELACDISVLKMLEESAYEDYGNTLINFAEKVSLSPFPFTAGLGGNRNQLKQRIINIASYKKPTFMKKLKSVTAFILTAVLLLGFTPLLSTYAADENQYLWESSSGGISNAKALSTADLSAYFGEYEGSFVLYDSKNDAWSIHNAERAALRTAPDSTYKIYDALFGLEEGVITPENSSIAWDGKAYPFETWNADQNLRSAMNASVNWYFQAIDKQLGKSSIYRYIQAIGYGKPVD